MLQARRVWRSIDLRDPGNRQIFMSGGKCGEIGLFEVIKYGLLERKLKAFPADDINSEMKPFEPAELLQRLSYYDSSRVQSFDASGVATEELKITKRYLNGTDVHAFLLKEDWVMDSKSGALIKYIVCLAPLVYDRKSETVVPLFWLYYPEWQHLFDCFEARNYYSQERISYHTLLSRKYFSYKLSKINNIFDRSIKATDRGEDRVLNNEALKEQLLHTESDLFNH